MKTGMFRFVEHVCLFVLLPLAAQEAGALTPLLVNGDFEDGGESPCGTAWSLGTGFFKAPYTCQETYQTANCFYEGTTFEPPGPFEGRHFGGTDVNAVCYAQPYGNIIQTVGVNPGQPLRLSGQSTGVR